MHCELLIAAALWASGQAAPAPAPPPFDVPPAKVLQMQYAQAKLLLAETNLIRIEQMNRRLARSVPSSVVAEFKSDVDEARLQVEQAASATAASEFNVWLRRAESDAQASVTRWKNAVEGNRRLKGTFDDVEIQRFRLRAEVARLQLERGRALAAAPREAQLEWQVELLNNEVEQLKEEQIRVSPFVRYYPLWWYY